MGQLTKHEKAIERYRASYHEAATSLLTIFEDDLWKEPGKYGSFVDYCDRRWNFKKSRAYQLLDAGRFRYECESLGLEAPDNERTFRPLMKIKAFKDKRFDEAASWEKRAEAWGMIVETGDEVTPEFVEDFVDVNFKGGQKIGPSEKKRKASAMRRLKRALKDMKAEKWSASEREAIADLVRAYLGQAL